MLLKKSLLVAILFLVFLNVFHIFFPNIVNAQTDFITDVAVQYRILPDGQAEITHRFTLENATTEKYATSYNLLLENIDPINLRAVQEGTNLRTDTGKKGDTTTLTVFFDKAVVGKGKSQTFSVIFTNTSFAVRTGEVWEISVPRLASGNAFRSYSVDLLIPSAFGNEAYISPKPLSSKIDGDFVDYKFSKEVIEKTGITAGFGAFQIFSFTLNYHLENPLAKKSQADIALPPDTALQRLYYQQIDPKPDKVFSDADGNWIATYYLEPRERIDITAKGAVQIFASVRPYPAPSAETLASNLKETQYWQTTAGPIKQLAQRLQTPKEIYNFVSQNLTYDYTRVRPNVERLGALNALLNPKNAICMEFTDLFIAIARSAGIPAREINGFAYTENPEIQPLSLVADVLHSWPEYWDNQLKSWIPVDPTWASTTGGVDYFSKLDLRHFTFVIHGRDATKPYPPGSYKLGSNPQKDVFVNFGQLPEKRISDPEINVKTTKFIPFITSKLEVTISNPGPVAIYDLIPKVYYDAAAFTQSQIEVLLPYSQTQFTLKVPFSFFGRNTPDRVTIEAADTQLIVPTYKNKVIIYNLLVVFLLLAILVVFILIKLKRISFQPLIKLRKNITGIVTHVKNQFRRSSTDTDK